MVKETTIKRDERRWKVDPALCSLQLENGLSFVDKSSCIDGVSKDEESRSQT